MSLGRAYGIASAFIAGTCTYLIWNHPWTVLIFTGEAVVVSWLYTRHKGNLVLYDLAYWFVLGIPLVYLFYHQVMGISVQSTLLIMLKQPVNGVTNALLATISLSLYRYLKKSKGIRTGYSELLFNAMAAFAILPIFLLSVYSIRTYQDNNMEMLRSQVSWVAESARKNLREWIATHHNNVQILSTLVNDPENNTFEKMQHYVEVIRSATPEFKGMGVFNDRAVTVAYSPLFQDGRSNLGIDMSGRAHIQVMKKTRKPYITDVIMSRLGKPKPIVVVVSPIISANAYKGYCSGVLEVDRVSGLLASLRKPETHITIVDGHNRVIASTRSDYDIMAPFAQPYIKAEGYMNSQTHLWQPAPRPNISVMQQWTDSFLFNDSRIPGESHWRVIVEASLLPVAKSTSQYCLAWLTIQALLILAAILISHIVSNRLIAGIKRLQLLTRSVPQLFHDSAQIQWPGSRVRELSELTENFKEMTASLIKHHTEQEMAEKHLRESEECLRIFIDHAPVSLAMFNREMCYINANLRWMKDYNLHRNDLVGLSHYNVFPEISDDWKKIHRRGLAGEVIRGEEDRFKRSDGSVRWFRWEVRPWRRVEGDVGGIIIFTEDTTEHKKAEAEKEKLQAQLTQAQKMESIGRLAGGVAHDFNNMLSIILGNSEIMLEDIKPEHPCASNLKEIQNAAQRSSDLTRQLLAFARKQTISPKVLNSNHIIEGMLKMLKRLIGEDIDLLWQPKTDLWPIKIDPSQIDQMLANLCVNARDAIKDVGKVTIETDNISFDEAYCEHHTGFIPGNYVLISISDSGCGMNKKTSMHLFEPFFTTKKKGEGTGLGLATVYGIVKQNNGFINVYSELDQGTTFKIYLPRYSGNIEEKVERKQGELLKGHETILLVEDEKAILTMIRQMLERLCYTVLTASTPDEAIRISNVSGTKIDLLITDVVMPSMNGRELAEKILLSFPNMKCLYMSGYTANVIAHRGILDEGLNFIGKPFSNQDLSIKLREIFD
nr:ATP-binding protein [uncultured Desulfobacter sp.]